MRLATIKLASDEQVAIISPIGAIPIDAVNRQLGKNWNGDMLSILEYGQLEEINTWYRSGGEHDLSSLGTHAIPLNKVRYAPPYRRPRKIWCIGLNYTEHAKDLLQVAPETFPTSFMKPDTTIIGHEDTIQIPPKLGKTTGEAELGIIIGKKCKNVERQDWLSVVAGFVNVIDVTEEDLTRQNPRYVTYAKCFDTFFSFGPHLVTPDEIKNVLTLLIATVKNAKTHAENLVLNMMFPPDFLVSFYSKAMTLLPGDIISTGTPRAVQIGKNDIVECRISGFVPLKNRIQDLRVR